MDTTYHVTFTLEGETHALYSVAAIALPEKLARIASAGGVLASVIRTDNFDAQNFVDYMPMNLVRRLAETI